MFETFNLFNEYDLFLDDCCFLTTFSALKITKNLNKVIY